MKDLRDTRFFYSYDSENIKNVEIFSKEELDAKMKNAKVVDVDAKGKIKCH